MQGRQQCRGDAVGADHQRGLERSTDAALVVAEHEGALDEVRHGRELVLAEHVLDKGEDALRCRRGRRHREDDARRLCPRRGSSVLLHVCQQSGRLFFKLFSVDFQFEILDEILLL